MSAAFEPMEADTLDAGADMLPELAPEPWGDPLPIPSMLLPVEPFDEALMPAALGPWVTDIADRMQCPPDFPAVAAMVALSSVIGRKACIAPKRCDKIGRAHV